MRGAPSNGCPYRDPESKIENRKLEPDSSLLKASFRDNCLTAEGAEIAEEGIFFVYKQSHSIIVENTKRGFSWRSSHLCERPSFLSRPFVSLTQHAKIAEKNRNKVKNKGYLLSKTKTFYRRGRGSARVLRCGGAKTIADCGS